MRAADPEWNERRNAFWMSLWKVESKIEDSSLKLIKFLDDVRPHMKSTPILEKTFLRWTLKGQAKFLTRLRVVDRIFEGFYTNEIPQLSADSEKIGRMTARVKWELDNYLHPTAVNMNSGPPPPIIIEMDPEAMKWNLKAHTTTCDYLRVMIEFRKCYIRLRDIYIKSMQRERKLMWRQFIALLRQRRLRAASKISSEPQPPLKKMKIS
jgi:hypothetical protein